jgi:transcription initiation factor IIF auxiliary subunit
MTQRVPKANVKKIPHYLLSLAGEYRVCSELNRRGVFATVTYGNRKSVDVYAISDRKERALKIEVKTSQQGNFVTKIAQKFVNEAANKSAPDFWVLVQMQPDGNESFKERFFVLTHEEICTVQLARNALYAKKYSETHGKMPDQSKGIDNVPVGDVEQFENQWKRIVERIGGPEHEDTGAE